MPKYTIITPMYNSFQLMEKYFESFTNQSYKDFEIILVDDGSKDGSYEQACEYAKKTELDLKVFKVERNAGPGNARNIGIDNAKGEWITFIDNDDWVDVSLLEKIDGVISSNDVNCVIYDYSTTDDTSVNRCYSMYKGENGFVDLKECIKYVRNHAVGKFYRLECLKDVRYPKLRKCEDVGFVCIAVAACNKIYYLKESLYFYFQRKGSLSNNIKLDETDMIKAFSIIEETLGQDYPEEVKARSVADLGYGVLLMMCKSKKSNKEIRQYISSYGKKYPKWYKCETKKELGMVKSTFLTCARFKQVWALKIFTSLHGRLV